MTNTIYSSSVLIIAKAEVRTLSDELKIIKPFTIQEVMRGIAMVIYIIILMQAYADMKVNEILNIDQKPQLLIENL